MKLLLKQVLKTTWTFENLNHTAWAWVGLAMDLFCVHFLSDLITLLICFEYTQDMSLVFEVRLGHVFTEHAPHIPRPLQFYIRMCL